MKIVYLHQYFVHPDQPGGTRSWEQARRWAAAGHEVAVVTSDRDVDRRDWTVTRRGGVEVHRVGVRYANALGFRGRMKAFLRFAAAAGRRAHAVGGDLVFATSTPLTIALPGIYAARRLRAPFVFEVRDLWPAVPIGMGELKHPALIAAARALERLAYREAAHVVALSPGMREGVLAAGVAPERVSVIPNACDFELFDVPAARGEAFRRRHPELGDAPLLIYAGAFGRANGVGWLVDVAAALSRSGAPQRIVIVGDGAERAQIEAKARRLGVLGEAFHILGYRPKAEMPELLAAASGVLSTLIAAPVLHHSSPNKVFDALAAGRPALVNYQGWLPELIRERGCGLALPRDPERAAGEIARAYADPEWVSRAGAAARALGRERFDRDTLARELEATLREVAARG